MGAVTPETATSPTTTCKERAHAQSLSTCSRFDAKGPAAWSDPFSCRKTGGTASCSSWHCALELQHIESISSPHRSWTLSCTGPALPNAGLPRPLARPHIARFQGTPGPVIARPPDDSGDLTGGMYRPPPVFKRKRAAHDVWTALQATHMHGRAATFSAPCPTFPKPDQRRAPPWPGQSGRAQVHGPCRRRWCGAPRPCRCQWPRRHFRRRAR